MEIKDYISARTVEEAVFLWEEDVLYFAGGTDLMVKAREKTFYQTKRFLDISGISRLKEIRETEEETEIGGAVTLTELLEYGLEKGPLSLLGKAIARVGTPQIRNRATLAGNVANACPASDCIPTLLVLEAEVVVEGKEGERVFPLKELYRDCSACLGHKGMHVGTCFFPDPAKKKLTLKPGELIKFIRIPKKDQGERNLFFKLTKNRSGDPGIMNMAMAGSVEKERITDFSMSLGGLFSCFGCLKEGDMIKGEIPSEELFAACGRAVLERLQKQSSGLADFEYKSEILQGIIEDGLKELFMGISMDTGKERSK